MTQHTDSVVTIVTCRHLFSGIKQSIVARTSTCIQSRHYFVIAAMHRSTSGSNSGKHSCVSSGNDTLIPPKRHAKLRLNPSLTTSFLLSGMHTPAIGARSGCRTHSITSIQHVSLSTCIRSPIRLSPCDITGRILSSNVRTGFNPSILYFLNHSVRNIEIMFLHRIKGVIHKSVNTGSRHITPDITDMGARK